MQSEHITNQQHQFETLVVAKRNTLKHFSYLTGRHLQIKPSILACLEGGQPCEAIPCGKCMRNFRKWSFRQILELYSKATPFSHARIFTVMIKDVAQGQLKKFDLFKTIKRYQKKLARLKEKGLIVVGGIEVSWNHELKLWRIHAHFLVLAQEEGGLNLVRDTLYNNAIFRSVRIDEIRSQERQISYLLKFQFNYMPFKRVGHLRPRCYPLPPELGTELASFYLNYKATDFLFCFGVKRNGSKLILTQK
jgi:hypothetical protein